MRTWFIGERELPMLNLFYVTCRGVYGSKSYVLTQEEVFKLLSIYITTSYCKVCAHERSLEGLRCTTGTRGSMCTIVLFILLFRLSIQKFHCLNPTLLLRSIVGVPDSTYVSLTTCTCTLLSLIHISEPTRPY